MPESRHECLRELVSRAYVDITPLRPRPQGSAAPLDSKPAPASSSGAQPFRFTKHRSISAIYQRIQRSGMANPDIPAEQWSPPDIDAEHVGTSRFWARAARALPRTSKCCGTTTHRRSQFVTLIALVVVIISAMTAVSISVNVPTARADEQQYEAFYTPPDPLPTGAPGDLIRTEPSRLVLEPSGKLGSFVGTGTRIMYRSTDAQGKPVAVTGTYIEPDLPWPGNGPRPLLAYATAPYGIGEQCAPSRLFNQGIHASLDTGFDLMFNIEEGFIATLLARGFAIVVTDGVGLGVHGPMAPQFLNRLAGGTAVLDAARAAMRLPGTSLNPRGPVAFWGWLAGGHSALAAAELPAAAVGVVPQPANGIEHPQHWSHRYGQVPAVDLVPATAAFRPGVADLQRQVIELADILAARVGLRPVSRVGDEVVDHLG
jgi:Secretory lipase